MGPIEISGCLLSFTTVTLGEFELVGKKNSLLYLHQGDTSALFGRDEGNEVEFLFGPDSSPKDCWWSLYKPPVDKWVGGLQWRIVHGVTSTNRHAAHLDPSVDGKWPFSLETERIQHLFIDCSK